MSDGKLTLGILGIIFLVLVAMAAMVLFVPPGSTWAPTATPTAVFHIPSSTATPVPSSTFQVPSSTLTSTPASTATATYTVTPTPTATPWTRAGLITYYGPGYRQGAIMRDGTPYDMNQANCAVDDGLWPELRGRWLLVRRNADGAQVLCRVVDTGYLARAGVVADLPDGFMQRAFGLGSFTGTITLDGGEWR